ncbi:hypothetical protein V6N11_081162 [Hibiscus sabdariffa]|uniref:Reverse transcriptase zinc-binding domain-containing protein n=1 Tax=Hibiscus sabdariffa TaxID=183260 RepID=A0ABR2QJ09_9ROSI
MYGAHLGPFSKDWAAIWTLSVPQGLRVFLWLVFRQKLMNNIERQRRHLGNNASCTQASRFSMCSETAPMLDTFETTRAEHYSMVVVASSPSRATYPTRTPTCQWSPPPSPWFCLNTNDSICVTTKYARADGLFQDHSGTWVQGFDRGIDYG